MQQSRHFSNASRPIRFHHFEGLTRPGALSRAGTVRRWLIRLCLALATFGGLWTLTAAPALAGFSVCNQTLDVVNVAIGRQDGDVFRTEGWWTIGSNQCATVIRDDLQVRYVFVYATDVFGQELLQGGDEMCIAAEKFTIEGTEQCWSRGYRQVPFLEVDTHEQDHWTIFLSDPADG